MDAPARPDVTRLLLAWRQGSRTALDALLPLVEAELRGLAGGYMRKERPDHTLQPTALINEAWLRMAQQLQPEYEGRSHFVAIAAQYMRQILVDHARSKKAEKRGAGVKPVSLEQATMFAPERSADVIALDEGLKDLAALDARQAQIVELRYFGGLENEEIAEFLGISARTVIRDLRTAQSWLKDYVAG